MYQKPVRQFVRMDSAFRVLITGFEPFGGHDTNISQLVVSGMSGRRTLRCPWQGAALNVVAEVDTLSVDARGAQRTAERLLRGERWDAILHVGLCDTCEVPRIERLAQDKLDMRLPDNAGRRLTGSVIDGQGDRGCWVDPTVWQPEAFPGPYDLSVDAGTYLCNETYHATLAAAVEVAGSSPLPPPVLFLHLPGEKHMPLHKAEAFVDACTAHLLRPYPEEPVHVVAAALRGVDGYLITRRARNEADGGEWEFPGGKCENDEAWSQTVVREIQEELALEVKPFHPLGSWYRASEGGSFVINLVACEEVNPEIEPSLTVHDALKWLDEGFKDVLPWAGRDGEMNDFVQTHITPKSSPHRPHSSNGRR